MKKTEIKKLTLKRESIRVLRETTDLRDVVGGVPYPTQSPGCSN